MENNAIPENESNPCKHESKPNPEGGNVKDPTAIRLDRLTFAISIAILIYGTYGLLNKSILLPTRRGGLLEMHGYSLYVLYGAMWALFANRANAIISNNSCGNKKTIYKRIGLISCVSGVTLFFGSLITNFVQFAYELSCENMEEFRVRNEVIGLDAVAISRHCSMFSSVEDTLRGLRVAIVPSVTSLKKIDSSVALMNDANITKMYWRGHTLFILYKIDELNGESVQPQMEMKNLEKVTKYSWVKLGVKLINVTPKRHLKSTAKISRVDNDTALSTDRDAALPQMEN